MRRGLVCQEITALNHSPIIFIAGMPRSGSMWTYNVCRKLITAAGKTPWPDEVPLDESPAIQHALSRPPAPNQVYCIKTHFKIPVGKPHIQLICNYRDIRDATLSYMRFMKCSFEKALAVAQGSMELTDHYLQQSHPHVYPLPYGLMVSNPKETIRSLANFLSLPVTDATIGDIARSLSQDAVRRHVEKIESHRQDTESGKSRTYSTAQNLDGSLRIYDHTTGFQSNHIGSGKDGEWRDMFTSEQQAELMAVTADWLTRYGFRH